VGHQRRGLIAGEGNDAGNTTYQAWRFDGSNYTFLGTLGGATSGSSAINLNGEVVGVSRTADISRHAFVYTGGQMFDLNALIPPESGWTLIEATGINNQGQIVATGTDPAGLTHAFLLTPVRSPGDTDYDGDVDLADLGTLATSYGATVAATWDMGNFDGDGDVDLADLGTLATNYGSGRAAAYAEFSALTGVEVPEPSGLAVVVMFYGACTALAARHNRRY
jgi:probable HAF family extracellular repeat protein